MTAQTPEPQTPPADPAPTPAPTPAPDPAAPSTPGQGVEAALTEVTRVLGGLTQAVTSLISEKRPDTQPGAKGAWFQRTRNDET